MIPSFQWSVAYFFKKNSPPLPQIPVTMTVAFEMVCFSVIVPLAGLVLKSFISRWGLTVSKQSWKPDNFLPVILVSEGMSVLSLYTPTLLTRNYKNFIFLNWANYFTISSLFESNWPLTSFKSVSLSTSDVLGEKWGEWLTIKYSER